MTTFVNCVTFVTGFVAAVLWFQSARVRVPDHLDTMVNEVGSVLSILKQQSILSAWAARFTAVSVLAQALLPIFSKLD